ncbi:UDP-glucose 4-epimerase [Richelia sinica FACHB-800]|uniref:UDP-glucose 4-epimerase n=1 Tax=Richelia sinica FACHB-800 TaxID=1357546 RepID=A0A975Y6L6_9NOST|nr:NAD-dependent epimerase/dehydratase family protein [Richelia sinica]MBD2664853.1 NAD-dependent epimerase/dehydratase family protein [Richelia sinica FACHB-800]QXE25411.1 UDP-glucose 4-epimerase [Richelia sinica FACHB-800]
MHFIITGGAGFIGSHLTENLLSADHRVTVVDNLSTGCLDNLPAHPHLTLVNKDILSCQPEDFTTPIDGIAHLAATASVTESWLHPLAAHHNNLSATLAVIELCHHLKIPRLVFTSSAAVYGNPVQLPIAEDHPTVPLSPYGLQKLVGEQYASLFSQQYDLSVVTLRLFNVFGPRQMPNSAYSGVISLFTNAMQQGKPISLYGDGKQTRDFVYVKDVAQAFAQALTTSLPSRSCLTCNIGTGKAISLLQLIDLLQASFPNWLPEINFLPARVGDIQDSQADISKASLFLNFTPHWSIKSAIPSFVKLLTYK